MRPSSRPGEHPGNLSGRLLRRRPDKQVRPLSDWSMPGRRCGALRCCAVCCGAPALSVSNLWTTPRQLDARPSSASLDIVRCQAETAMMKEDVLEQVVEDYLQLCGYFTRHNLRFKPGRDAPGFVSSQDSVPSDI